jgi:hypothetical protein
MRNVVFSYYSELRVDVYCKLPRKYKTKERIVNGKLGLEARIHDILS